MATIDQLEKQYFFLNDNRSKLLDNCTNQGQRDKVWQNWTVARDNLHEAQNRIFVENDPMVAAMASELAAIQQKIENMTNNLKNIVQTLNTISDGVRLASSLIILGSSL